MTQPNDNGVYSPDETLRLERSVKGWKGRALAEIDLACVGDRWIWATGYQMYSGDMAGAASPLMDHKIGADDRETALNQAIARLRKQLSGRNCGDSAAVMAWLDTLIPQQFDLFGAVA